ncbi:MAG: 4-hydroxy-tetrahydrodipicolinate reductase [Bacteroidetes bacterium]|nr:4-hydroxy-tetrahydrodipicolinate reductase [Bacteroidota bacterium]
MKIALIGYGKMGKMIEQVAIKRGHTIVARIDKDSGQSDWEELKKAHVAIEFSKPDTAVENIKKCFALNLPVVVGTTGWYEHIEEIKQLCQSGHHTILPATNFSIGVNLFFHINKKLAQAMENLPEYDVLIEETHHTQKLDAPSGTAITIAQGILAEISRKSKWALSADLKSEQDLSITSHRIDDVPGTHMVRYTSDIDDIEIKHTAHNRSGFAIGAVVAAEWIKDKKGFFSMSDLIGF